MKGFELPTERTKGESDKVKNLLIISRPKMGKTHALMQLENSICINTDRSAEYYDGVAIDVLKMAVENGKSPIGILKFLQNEIKEANAKKGGYMYKFGIIDTITSIEDWCEAYATRQYKKSSVGQEFKGTSVINELDYGAGYNWLRSAFKEMVLPFFSLFEYTILVGHIRDSSLNIHGKALSVQDLDLTGKIKRWITSECDAIGTLYQHPENLNQRVLSFKTDINDIITGSRVQHVAGKDIVISEMDEETRELKTFWDRIYPELKNIS